MKITPLPAVLVLLAASAVGLHMVRAANPDAAVPNPGPQTMSDTPNLTHDIYKFTLNSLAGQPVDLAKYKGKVLLVVNTASKCGFTPQYAGLEKLQEKYQAQGLQVLGFPSNDFGAQEPGTSAEITEFCKVHYGVTFDMFSKLDVKGPNQAPLYHYLTEKANPDLTGDVSWNFEKFLVSRDGRVVGRFKSKVTPQSDELTSAIEEQLKQKA